MSVTVALCSAGQSSSAGLGPETLFQGGACLRLNSAAQPDASIPRSYLEQGGLCWAQGWVLPLQLALQWGGCFYRDVWHTGDNSGPGRSGFGPGDVWRPLPALLLPCGSRKEVLLHNKTAGPLSPPRGSLHRKHNQDPPFSQPSQPISWWEAGRAQSPPGSAPKCPTLEGGSEGQDSASAPHERRGEGLRLSP